jgi:hypothetical protein
MVAMTSSQIVCDGNKVQFANRNQQQSEHKVMATRTNLQIETNVKRVWNKCETSANDDDNE